METEPPLPGNPPPLPAGSSVAQNYAESHAGQPTRLIPASHETSHGRRRHGYETHFRRGRMWLIAIFGLLRLLDGLCYLNFIQMGLNLKYLHPTVIVAALWTTALLVGMWMRLGWARYIMVALMSISAVTDTWVILDYLVKMDDPLNTPLFAYLMIAIVLHISIIYLLVGVKAIRRLTNRSYA